MSDPKSTICVQSKKGGHGPPYVAGKNAPRFSDSRPKPQASAPEPRASARADSQKSTTFGISGERSWRTARWISAAFAAVFLLSSAPSEAGNQTTPASPKRIITIAPNAAEIICALGACDRIIGVSKFCVYPSELRDRAQVGGLFDPNLEKIMALRPDLVIMRGKIEPLQELCAERGIPVYFDETDSLAGVATCVRDLGQRLGLEARAAALVIEFHQQIEAVRHRVDGLQKPRVLLTLSRRPDRLVNILTTGKGTFLDDMLRIAGGENVFGYLDMRYPQVSAEAILAQRPDLIIELMPEVVLSSETRRRMLNQWKELGTIPATSTGRVHFLNDDHCLIPSLRYIEIIEKVSRILHPSAWATK